MKTSKLFLGSALLLAIATTTAYAEDTPVDSNNATVISYNVEQIDQIATTGAATLSITQANAVAGVMTKVTDTTTKYQVTTNAITADARKVTAKIATAMASGLELTIKLASLTGAGHGTTTELPVVLTATDQTVLTDVAHVAGEGIITLEMTATPDVAAFTTLTRVLTLTLVDVGS